MFEKEVVPRLQALSGIENVPEFLELKFAGIGESDFHEGIDDRLAAISSLEHGYCARPGEVDLRLMGAEAAIREAREVVREAFGNELVSDNGANLEHVVVDLLAKRGRTLAIAESCTGGLIASRITDVAGSSRVFRYGFVTYANEAKQELLGVSSESLRDHGAVSNQVARQMAEGALTASEADIGVAVTGIAGPAGGSEEKPVGTVFLALAERGRETRVYKQFHPWARAAFKRQVSQAALNLVRLTLGK
jgi:nicotinamide-nucleotide amidase